MADNYLNSSANKTHLLFSPSFSIFKTEQFFLL